MFCPRCEINYHRSLDRCVNCRTKLTPGIICMECGTRNKENATVCNLCGKVLVSKMKFKSETEKPRTADSDFVRVCPYGHVNDSRNIFCSTCGEFLELKKEDEARLTGNKATLFTVAFNYISSLF